MSNSNRWWLIVSLCLFPFATLAHNLLETPEVQNFIAEMEAKHQMPRQELSRLFGEARKENNVIEAISRPAESKKWHEYRKIFITPERIAGGLAFVKKYQKELTEAEWVFGVPKEIIAAVIGVETKYGQQTGRYRLIDSLTTLAFWYPRRGAFFRSELEEFLLLAQEEKLDALSVLGSYAGAIGYPQFISSSYRRYAVDFDGDNRRDLLNNPTDAIGSVGNYFRVHGWLPQEAVISKAKISGKGYQKFIDKGLKPTITLAEFQQNGVTIDEKFPSDKMGTLIQLDLETGPEYWIGWQNFFAITEYNHSALYAMAVYQLSRKISEALHADCVTPKDCKE